ncbi:hypothetical protein GGF39_002213 [Coemansia sp. RSA 1721]|nr:hypothetical protein GGF39_002213 [Coemansia sp. RSA 1721]
MANKDTLHSLLGSSETLDTYVLPFSSSSVTIVQRTPSETDSPPLSFSFSSKHRARLSSTLESAKPPSPSSLHKELRQYVSSNRALLRKSLCIIGIVIYVGLSVAYGTVHKLILADQRRFEHPFFVHIAAMGCLSLVLELGGLMAVGRKSAMRAGRTLPLAMVYVGAQVTRHWAMQRNSIHGGVQMLLAVQPLVVAFMGRQKIPCISAPVFWVVAATCVSVAVAVWSPAFSMVYFEESMGPLENASKLYWLATSWSLAMAAVMLGSLFYVSVTRFFDHHPGVSLAMFARHFASLSFLLLLVAWPMVESPVGVLESINSENTWVMLGVALAGALVFVLRLWLLREPLVGGPAGLCMIEHYRTLVCLGIGWWAYGYLYWWLQVLGMAIGAGGLILWSLIRIIQV